jgi:hypothetical protein
MQANDARIRELGILAKEVYEHKYFREDDPKLQIVDHDFLTTDYNVIETDAQPSGFQGMLLEELDSEGEGTGNFVFAFRGTEIDSGWKEFVKDLVITDIVYMGSGTAPQQMKDAMSFINRMMTDEALKLTLDASNTTFTGHSLGGSLANMASYVFGFDAYGYNPFTSAGRIRPMTCLTAEGMKTLFKAAPVPTPSVCIDLRAKSG